MAKVGIVIVNYNGAQFQNECIRSIYNMKYKDIKIIVVDSGSSDDSIEMLRNEFDDICILEQNENVGVAAGNNIGIRYSIQNGIEYTLLLNNDTELDSDLLDKLLSKADERTITVPKIYFYDQPDMLWYAGGGMDWHKGTGYHRGLKTKESCQFNDECLVEYSPTCCMLINNKIFSQIGMIDEATFMYYDDTDLCARLTDNGYKILYVPSAKMWHKVSSSSGGMQSKIGMYYNNRNKLYFVNKYRNKINAIDRFIIRGKIILKGVRGVLLKTTEKYMLTAYSDYKNNRMGRRDSL